MQTIDVVKGVLNKSSVATLQNNRRGPKGYGLLLILRLLLYGVLTEKFSTRKLIKHLRKNNSVVSKLGFESIPVRRSIDDWKQNYDSVLSKLRETVGDKYPPLHESDLTILDSTPIEDKKDLDGCKGYSSKGEFWGFKIHASCDEYCVLLRAIFTTGNVHDSRVALLLLANTNRVGGDCAYDSEELKIKVIEQKSKGYFVHNPRREGKSKKKPTPKILKKFRVFVEQCNSIIKEQVRAGI